MRAEDAARMRIVRQAIRPAAADPTEAVTRLLALQAQDLAAATTAISVRSGGDERAVEEALAAGRIVRTWIMRGTILATTPADLPWLIGLASARTDRSAAPMRSRAGIDEAEIGRAREVAEAALDGDGLGRADLLRALEAAGIATAGDRGYHLLLALGSRGHVVMAGRDGKQVRFRRAADLVPAADPVEPDEGLVRLAVRYAAGHGPATARDLAWWSAQTLTDVRRGIAAAGDLLETVDVDDEPMLVAAGTVPTAAELAEAGAANRLPAFDELALGYADRSLLGDPDALARLAPGANGRFLPFTVEGGRIAAVG